MEKKVYVAQVEISAAEAALMFAPIPNPGKATIPARVAGRIGVEVARQYGLIALDIERQATATFGGNRHIEAALPIGGADDRSDEVRG